ncbi:chromosome segregation protein SMC [Facklamia miroungae]|uniref:Chromosome partition protein Smc n=1 Tax=Facklamia miroungae TaxID=120956 RepID=A0A1G7PPA3_9LACT|nr:chromosome segregation protein SMC [Facklamia miroungae]NKZ28781.1 chromosome segregation protein SMC [Facklamia miroungae]SDF88088.1 condensin subunit Smc [Facklamia miroungae]
MYLEKIEMTGFKSFADKTVINFDQGMTAVVGPNGSGKSNLSEAIRWVLGEQSAKSLRGNKMEDVIFNGSLDRKPVNIAKVSLILNNEDRYIDMDHKTITITRQYNRNGESQFFINQKAVRLKDITDLLLDTGLGKNSFAMISQGKVESIFLSKPEERRGIFEEAAGVQKYQHRKNEAQRKLTRSQDHLNRVRDILYELKNQLQPLKEQREKALTYQSKANQLKEEEISLYTFQIEDHKARWQKAKDQYQDLSQTLEKVKSNQKSFSQSIYTKQNQLDEINQKIDFNELESRKLIQKIERFKGQIEIFQQKTDYANQSSQERKLNQERHQNQLVNHHNQQAELKQKLASLQDEIQVDQKSIQSLTQKLSDFQTYQNEDLDQLRGQLIDYYRQESSLKNRLHQSNKINQQYDQRKASYQEQIANIQAQIEALNDQASSFQAQSEQLTVEIDKIKEEGQKAHQAFDQAQAERDQIRSEIYQAEHHIQMLESKQTSLLQMQSDYVGYYQGVRAVMNHRDQIQGIIGTVAELIQVEKRYQTAIDIALGASMQNIVVVDDHAAKTAIRFLKEEKAGRATFLPRTNMKGRSLKAHQQDLVAQARGVIGLASQLVTYDAINQAVIEQLLATTIIVDSLENAQSLAKGSHQQLKIVTLEGELILPGGSVTGGRDKQKSNSVIGRSQELKNIEQELDQLKLSHQKRLSAFETSKQTVVNCQTHYQKVLADHQKYSQDQQRLINLYDGIKTQLDQKQNHLLLLNDELKQMTVEVDASKQDYQLADQELEALKNKIEEVNQAIQAMQLSQSEKQVKINQLQETLNESKTHLAILQMEVKQKQESLQNEERQAQHLQEQINASQQLQATGHDEVQDLKAKIAQFIKDLDQAEQELIEYNEALDHLRKERQELNESLRSNQLKLKEIEDHLQQQYQAEAKCQAQIEKFEEQMDQDLLYLNETYALSYEASTQLAKPVQSLAKVKEIVKKLRKEIDQLGPINLAAIDDYEELNERYQLLDEQENDLLTAMDQLNNTIEEMDSEVAHRFKEAFEAINDQFQKTFHRLFGGGKAKLELTDPSDLLTTGVDIIAQPPGKRKQNLALLSGGERALTAIALLFAILETKTVPFVVLDEVEAALDDANVYRYGEYIQNFTQETQFIVITHRKGTMEYADVLYGVTMEQTGISKLAAVRMNDFVALEK